MYNNNISCLYNISSITNDYFCFHTKNFVSPSSLGEINCFNKNIMANTKAKAPTPI